MRSGDFYRAAEIIMHDCGRRRNKNFSERRPTSRSRVRKLRGFRLAIFYPRRIATRFAFSAGALYKIRGKYRGSKLRKVTAKFSPKYCRAVFANTYRAVISVEVSRSYRAWEFHATRDYPGRAARRWSISAIGFQFAICDLHSGCREPVFPKWRDFS